MKLHYKGKYNLNPNSLPHGEHKCNAVPFTEFQDIKKFSLFSNCFSLILIILLAALAFLRCKEFLDGQLMYASIVALLLLFPHEILHAICFKNDVYLYTNWKQGMLFVVGPETMSKSRFVIMSLLPNIVLGFIPYTIGMIFPSLVFFSALGTLTIGIGVGDYYNVFNALTQMPKGARTYLHKQNSFWYMPKSKEYDHNICTENLDL